MGCTYRLLTRETVRRIQDKFTVGGSHFGPELMLLTIVSGARVVEVPVNYLPRVGVSSVTGDLRKAIILGIQMIAFILKFRLATLGRGQSPAVQRTGTSIAPRARAKGESS